jgi:hypothetical protein
MFAEEKPHHGRASPPPKLAIGSHVMCPPLDQMFPRLIAEHEPFDEKMCKEHICLGGWVYDFEFTF